MNKGVSNFLFLWCAAFSIMISSCAEEEEQPPIITFISPLTAAVGDTVVITGLRFDQIKEVLFSSEARSQATVINSSSTMITTTVPADANLGENYVVVSAKSGYTHHYFTVLPPVGPPVITGIDPTEGEVGREVTLSGTALANAECVTFGATKACLSANTETSITTTVPAGADIGLQEITVTTPGGTVTQEFTVK